MQTAAKTVEEIETIRDILGSFARAAARVYFPQTDEKGNPSIAGFFLDNGRLPFITDEIKPWRYCGWLVPYLQLSEAHPLVSPRYDYVLRTLDAGKLPDEPLPQISFVGEHDQLTRPGMKMLNECLDKVERSSGSWNGIRELCEWVGFALGVTNESSKLSLEVQEFLYRIFTLEPLLLHPSDYLGQMLCETRHGKKNGFYPTPIHVVDLMTQMVNCHKSGDLRREKTMDPCVGTGRMLLIASNYSMRLYGQDIDPLCCLITKINLALYAPWFYIPDSYFGDEITMATAEPNSEVVADVINELIQPVETASPEEVVEHSLYERMHKQKDNKRQRRKYSIEIENLPLFQIK